MQMNISNRIPVRLRFLMLIGVILIFSLFSGITFLNTMNSISNYRQFEKDFDNYFNILHTIDHQLQNLGESLSDSSTTNDDIINDLTASYTVFLSDVEKIRNNPLIEDDTLFLQTLNQVSSTINSLNKDILYLTHFDQDNSFSQISKIHSKYIDPLIEARIALRDMIYDKSFEQQKKYSVNLLVVLVFSLLIITFSVSLNAVNTNRNLTDLLKFIRRLEKGRKTGKLYLRYGNEFTEISGSLNVFLDKQDEKIRYLKTIGEGTESDDYIPDKNDIIGNEIKIMAERLKKIQIEENNRQTEEQKRNWNAEGVAQFAELLRSERENVKELSFLIVQKLVTYLNVEMGTIFLTSDSEGDEKKLDTIAAYAYDRRKYINKSFRFGEGLPGTCALEKEKIYINEVPEEYSDVISGVGRAKPKYVLLVPLKIEDEIFGILELASFRGLEEHELEFLDQLAESIASTLLAVKTNERTASLLRQSQDQADKLLRQEEDMKINMNELEKAQEESHKKESEITGILNAMNESSLVAEFGLNGRYSHINDKFLQLMESPSELILGKHHHEFALVEKYSDEYKKFWADLKNGKIISLEEQLKLYTGKEIWLQQTFTPIRDTDGKIFKILNIAVNITNAKRQQESLEKQAGEITRQHLEMESLNEAVNSAIIKCELDQEGIILDSNKNFETISGYNRKEILGRNYRLFLKDIEKEQFEKIWQEVLKGKTYQGTIRRTKPTGEEAWLMSTFSPVRSEERGIYKIYFLALDITEKRLKYQLLEEANKEIERLRGK